MDHISITPKDKIAEALEECWSKGGLTAQLRQRFPGDAKGELDPSSLEELSFRHPNEMDGGLIARHLSAMGELLIALSTMLDTSTEQLFGERKAALERHALFRFAALRSGIGGLKAIDHFLDDVNSQISALNLHMSFRVNRDSILYFNQPGVEDCSPSTAPSPLIIGLGLMCAICESMVEGFLEPAFYLDPHRTALSNILAVGRVLLAGSLPAIIQYGIRPLFAGMGRVIEGRTSHPNHYYREVFRIFAESPTFTGGELVECVNMISTEVIKILSSHLFESDPISGEKHKRPIGVIHGLLHEAFPNRPDPAHRRIMEILWLMDDE